MTLPGESSGSNSILVCVVNVICRLPPPLVTVKSSSKVRVTIRLSPLTSNASLGSGLDALLGITIVAIA